MKRNLPDETPSLRAIGSALQIARFMRGWSMQEAATASGVASSSIMRLEHGENAGTLRTFLAVCRGLRLRPGKVLDAIQDNSQAANRKAGR